MKNKFYKIISSSAVVVNESSRECIIEYIYPKEIVQMTLLFRLYWLLRLFRHWNVRKWRLCQLNTELLVKQSRHSVLWHVNFFFFAHKTQRKWFLFGFFVVVWLYFRTSF